MTLIFEAVRHLDESHFALARGAMGSDLSPRPHIPSAALVSLGSFEAIFEQLQIKPKQVLLSKDLIELFEPISCPCDLNLVTAVAEKYEQQGSQTPMGFLVVEVYGSSGKKPIFHGHRIFAIRGGFARR